MGRRVGGPPFWHARRGKRTVLGRKLRCGTFPGEGARAKHKLGRSGHLARACALAKRVSTILASGLHLIGLGQPEGPKGGLNDYRKIETC